MFKVSSLSVLVNLLDLRSVEPLSLKSESQKIIHHRHGSLLLITLLVVLRRLVFSHVPEVINKEGDCVVICQLNLIFEENKVLQAVLTDEIELVMVKAIFTFEIAFLANASYINIFFYQTLSIVSEIFVRL
jgi:hypothetical protein